MDLTPSVVQEDAGRNTMGNRESIGLSDTDCLDSSTDSTSLSGGYRRHPDDSPTASSAQFKRQQQQRPLSLPPESLDPASDLCSVLNHHHDSVFDPTDRGGCACRRSVSTSGCGGGACGGGERPRILPIVRNGRQLSDDMYWVLPERRKHQQQLQVERRQARLSSSGSSEQSCCEPLSFHAPGCSPLDLVRRVTDSVFGVTDEESYLSLSLHHWDTDKAVRYLKVEQLFRSGVCDRGRCVQLLELHSWNLDSVVHQLNRQRFRRSESS